MGKLISSFDKFYFINKEILNIAEHTLSKQPKKKNSKSLRQILIRGIKRRLLV